MSLSEMMTSGEQPPAGATPPAAPPAADPPLTYQPWMDTFGADPLEEGAPSARDFLAKKGFKSPDEVAKSLRSAEQALHARIPIPKPEEADKWAEVWTKLGRPESPDKYAIGAPDGFQPDPAFTKPFAERAHAAGLTQAQVEQMVGWWNETAIQSLQGQAQAAESQKAALRAEWGAKFNENVALMNRGAAALGLDSAGVDKLGQAFGVDGAAKLLANWGSRVGEDLLHQGDSVVTTLSVEELRAELNRHVRENGAAIRSNDPTAKATHARLIAQLAAAEQARFNRR